MISHYQYRLQQITFNQNHSCRHLFRNRRLWKYHSTNIKKKTKNFTLFLSLPRVQWENSKVAGFVGSSSSYIRSIQLQFQTVILLLYIDYPISQQPPHTMNKELVYAVLSNNNRLQKKYSPKRMKVPWKKQYKKRRQRIGWTVNNILKAKGYHLQYCQVHCGYGRQKRQHKIPCLYGSNVIIETMFQEQQSRLIQYFGGKPVYRAMSSRQKRQRKQMLGYGPRKHILSYIFDKIMPKVKYYGLKQGFEALKTARNRKTQAKSGNSQSDDEYIHNSESETQLISQFDDDD